MDAAERAFQILTTAPAPLSIDGRTLTGLPQRFVGLDELRTLMLKAGRRQPVVDVVWRELVVRARRDGPAWVVAATGMALPGMRRRASMLMRGWHGDRNDLDSELLLGFLERLRSIDVEAPNICSRLIDAGARAVKRARQHDEEIALIHELPARSVPPARPWDHPDFVLARAVVAGIISARDGELISRTRLDGETLTRIAGEFDAPLSTVTSWRYRAERRLTEAITAGDLHWVGLSPTG